MTCPTSGIIWEHEMLEHDDERRAGFWSSLAETFSTISAAMAEDAQIEREQKWVRE